MNAQLPVVLLVYANDPVDPSRHHLSWFDREHLLRLSEWRQHVGESRYQVTCPQFPRGEAATTEPASDGT